MLSFNRVMQELICVVVIIIIVTSVERVCALICFSFISGRL